MISVLFALPKGETFTEEWKRRVSDGAAEVARLAGREGVGVRVTTTGDEFKVSFGRSRGWDDWPKVAVSRRNPLTGARVYDMLLVKVDGFGQRVRAGLVGKTTGMLVLEAAHAGLAVAGIASDGTVFRVAVSLYNDQDYTAYWLIQDADAAASGDEDTVEQSETTETVEDIF